MDFKTFDKAYNLVSRKNHLIARLEGIKTELKNNFAVSKIFKGVLSYPDVLSEDEMLAFIARYQAKLEREISDIDKEFKKL